MNKVKFRPVWTCFPITEVNEETIRTNILRVWSNMHWTSVLPMMQQFEQAFRIKTTESIDWNKRMKITESGVPLIDVPYSVGFGGKDILQEEHYDTIKNTRWIADDAFVQALSVMIHIAPSSYSATIIHSLCKEQWYDGDHRREKTKTK